MNRRWTWIAVQAWKGEERAAVQRVERQQIEAYLPIIKNQTGRRVIPMFAEYFFARWTPEWTRIANTRGVQAVVMAGAVPGIIPNRFVREIQARENERGVVELDDRKVVLPTRQFSDGESVTPRSGSFLGQLGIVSGAQQDDMVRVMFTILGKTAVAEFHADDLEEAVLEAA